MYTAMNDIIKKMSIKLLISIIGIGLSAIAFSANSIAASTGPGLDGYGTVTLGGGADGIAGIVTHIGSSTEFEDTWTLTVSGPATVTLIISHVDLDLYDWSVTDLLGNLTGSGAIDAGIEFTQALADTTDYILTITGGFTGFGGGSYDVLAQISAVPLPAAVWCFGSALVGLAVVGRKRRIASPNSSA